VLLGQQLWNQHVQKEVFHHKKHTNNVMWGRTYSRRRQDQQHLPDRQHLLDQQHLPDRQHLMGRTYSRRRRARDVRRAAERAEHTCEKDSATRG
jgi:hypothetical protein